MFFLLGSLFVLFSRSASCYWRPFFFFSAAGFFFSRSVAPRMSGLPGTFGGRRGGPSLRDRGGGLARARDPKGRRSSRAHEHAGRCCDIKDLEVNLIDKMKGAVLYSLRLTKNQGVLVPIDSSSPFFFPAGPAHFCRGPVGHCHIWR